MLDLERAPEPIGPFVEWLDTSGFRLTHEDNRDCFNQYVIYERDGVRFDLIVDRGDWTIGMAMPGFRDTFLADSWEAYLDGYPLAGDLSSLEHQIAFLTTRLDEALRAAAQDSTCEAKMRADGEDYVRRRLGITGYEQRDAEALRAAMPSRPKTRPLP